MAYNNCGVVNIRGKQINMDKSMVLADFVVFGISIMKDNSRVADQMDLADRYGQMVVIMLAS